MDDRELSALLSDAVADVEPADRLADIQGRTSPHRARRGWYAVGGAVLASAAVVTAIALLGNQGESRTDDRSPAATSTPDPATPTAGLSAYPVYYIGDSPTGLRLYREFHQLPPLGGDRLQVLESPPLDPNYSTPWAPGSFAQVSLRQEGPDFGQIDVTIADAFLHDRPTGMSRAEAELAIQQVIYTAQALFQQVLPVQFRLGANPVDQVLGVPTSEPLDRAPQLDVLSLVSITNPSERREVDDHFTAEGLANSYEATVPWQILRGDDDVVLEGFATADGWMDDRLFPWRTRVDVSSLDPGTYTFRATTADPSDGEGPGPYEDTRTIVVR